MSFRREGRGGGGGGFLLEPGSHFRVEVEASDQSLLEGGGVFIKKRE